MSAEQQNFSGGAVQTTLTAILHTTDLTMSVASTTNYPASGLPFVLTVDQGNAAAQESVFVRSWTGTTLTLDSVKGRGYDGTTASQHQVGAVVVHTPDAAFMADLSARAFAVTTQGDIPYVTASAGVVMGRLPIGSAYWVVASNGATPVYQSSPQSVFTGTGDLLYSSAPNTLARLAGSTANNGKVLVVSSGLPTWGTDPAVAAETARAELAEPAHFLSNTGDILIASASSTPSNLARGAQYQELQMGGSLLPVWGNGALATMTGTGDLLISTAPNTIARLGVGTAPQVLTVSAATGLPSWANALFTPATKTTAYTALPNDLVLATASLTVTLPSPAIAAKVGVIALYAASNGSPVTIQTPSGNIIGPGMGTGVSSFILGARDAFAVVASDGTNYYVTAGAQDTGWINAYALFSTGWSSAG